MLRHLITFFRDLVLPRPVRLAVVRRYADANGSYVGELYMEGTFAGVSSYRMIGVSLDTLPFDLIVPLKASHYLDTEHDFLAPMPRLTLRVGALDPADNDNVRRMIAGLPKRAMTLMIRNGFIEHVLDRKP